MLTPSWPRFLSVGDKAYFGGVVHNQQKKGGSATVTIESLDPNVLSISGGQANVPVQPGASSEVRFDAVAKSVGSARIRMRVTMGRENDAFEDVIPVRVLVSPETVAAYGEAKLIENPNLFYAVAIVQPGHTPEEVQKELQTQLDRVKTEGVTADELNRAKRQFARDYILGRETVQQKALHLAHAVVIHNDIKTADGEFDLFQNVTVADVQRVARTYFTPESRMLLTILPRTPAAPGAPLPPIGPAPTRSER